MQKWYQIFQRNTGLNPYVWVVFYILPFYFFSSSSTSHIVLGTIIILVFFACYVLAFVAQGWLIYFWTSVQIAISITMTLLFSYMYFSIFIAFLIGNIKSKAAFTTLYIVLMVCTIGLINYGFVSGNPVFIKQIPFILLNLLGVILIPITTFNRNKSDRLQVQLEDANKKISELIKLEERQRIARDLHDTLGQKLSLIGLKSDLAGKLMDQYPERAHAEINDVRLTARSALKEVREMVTQMRGMRLEDELLRIRQILKAAHIEFTLEGDPKLEHTSLMNENVLSMCMKEAVTNVVKHSGATACSITIEPSRKELTLRIQDNGVGVTGESAAFRGNGLQGMKERLEFVNGCMELRSDQGTALIIKVPNITEKPNEEVGP